MALTWLIDSLCTMPSGPQQHSLSNKSHRIAGAIRAGQISPTALVLIAANLLPLYGVLVLGWAVLPMMVLFWLENIVIGVLNIPRILIASQADSARWARKFFLVLFFTVHYGLFTAIHGLFVFSMFGGNPYMALVDGLWTMDAARRAIMEYSLWSGIAALTASHLFSFFWNYLGQRENQNVRPEALMRAPYNRVVMLQITILIGGLLIQMFNSPLWALLLLIGLKIGVDLRAHLKEHRGKEFALNPTASP
jgi:hypothetical protein